MALSPLSMSTLTSGAASATSLKHAGSQAATAMFTSDVMGALGLLTATNKAGNDLLRNV